MGRDIGPSFASTHYLLWERGCLDLAAVAGPAILDYIQVTCEHHDNQSTSHIVSGVLSHPMYTPYKVYDNHGTQYMTLIQH